MQLINLYEPSIWFIRFNISYQSVLLLRGRRRRKKFWTWYHLEWIYVNKMLLLLMVMVKNIIHYLIRFIHLL